MYELSDNREVEEKVCSGKRMYVIYVCMCSMQISFVRLQCRKEIMEVLGDRPQPSAADLDQMTYLNLTIKEALRHYSVYLCSFMPT